MTKAIKNALAELDGYDDAIKKKNLVEMVKMLERVNISHKASHEQPILALYHCGTVILDPEGISKLKDIVVHNNIQCSNKSFMSYVREFGEVFMEKCRDAIQTRLGRDVSVHRSCISREEDCIGRKYKGFELGFEFKGALEVGLLSFGKRLEFIITPDC